MAVEARHLNLFPPQILGNREMMNAFELNNMYSSSNNNNNNGSQMGMGYRGNFPADSGSLLPMYSCLMAEKTPAIKSESGLSYNHHPPNPAPRKRSRDSMISNNNPLLNYQNPAQIKNTTSPISFLGQDISLQIHQQQLDIDTLISQHMEKVRMELEEKRKRQARRIIESIEDGMIKRLRAKEEEIEKMGKINWALEERVKSLCIENQIWRDLAQTNEATANALRTNLEQVLAAAQANDSAEADDAQSCCGSTGAGEAEDEVAVAGRRTLAGGAQDRMCRNCGEEESSVLLLPCRHLCLCTVCGSSLNTCPICKATKNASFHVNMS